MPVEAHHRTHILLVCITRVHVKAPEFLPSPIKRCFCGAMPDPKPPRLATPHSCAGPCTRKRACAHPCALACHPGPCPPCQVTIQRPCHCGKQTLTYRCSSLAPSRNGTAASLSCGQICNKELACGSHKCQDLCHDGSCTPCQVRGTWRCYCGQSEKDLACGQGVEKLCAVIDATGGDRWYGRFQCDKPCNRCVPTYLTSNCWH